jgi:hypothetical protein
MILLLSLFCKSPPQKISHVIEDIPFLLTFLISYIRITPWSHNPKKVILLREKWRHDMT